MIIPSGENEVADHDLAGDALGRHTREAIARVVQRSRVLVTPGPRVDEARIGHAARDAARGTSTRDAARRDQRRAERACPGGGGDRGRPRCRARMVEAPALAGVAGGGGDEHARRVGVQQRQLERADRRLARAADREVEDVDAVADRAIDGGDDIDARAQARDPARLVDGEVSGGRGAGEPVDAEEVPADRRVDSAVADGRGRHVSAVSDFVARREIGGFGELSGLMPSAKYRAPISLSVHVVVGNASPPSQAPNHSSGGSRRRSANDGDSGVMPLSITPTTTPLPA